MRKETKTLTVSAMLTSLIVVIVIISTFFPTLSLTLAAVSGLIPAIAVVEYGYRSAFGIYITASVLSMLLSPDKGNALLFIIIFGHYPIIKSVIEKLRKPVLEWIMKILSASIILAVLYFLFNTLFQMFLPQRELSFIIIWILYIIMFIVYDLAFTKLITIYNIRLSKFFRL